MMTSEILKFVDFTKTRKSRYLLKETFLLEIKKLLMHIKGYFMAKNSFVAEVTLKTLYNKILGIKILAHKIWH